MKKLLLGLFASVALVVPTLAHQVEDNLFYTYEAMECMHKRLCTVGVDEVNINDFYDDEIRTLLVNLDQMGVKVYESNPQYFVDSYHALYYSDVNKIFLNREATNDFETFIKALRHEGWHAAQDCMAAGMYNSDIMPLLEAERIPSEVIQQTFALYGYEPRIVGIEREAMLAMDIPWMTVEALEACNSDTPIWEVYNPPKKTWSYLYWNGLVNYHDGI